MNSARKTHHTPITVRVLAIVLACVCLTGTAGAQQGGEPIGLFEYRVRLDRLIQQLETAPPASAGQALDRARSELAAVSAVTLPTGDTIEVESPLSPLVGHTEALGRLRLLRSQLSAAAGDNTTARQTRLRAILARPEFARRDAELNLLQQALRWLRDRLPDNLPGLPGGLADAVGIVVVAGGLVFIAVLLSYWLQGFVRGFVTNAEARRRQDAGDEVPLTAAAARQQAAALAQMGSYRQAMRQLYLAALLRLDEIGALRYDRSQTNREVLAQLPVTSTTRSHMAPVVDTFDRIWYGVREPDQETYTSYAAEVDWLTTSVEPVVGDDAQEAR